jgi:hypothetical protein
MSDQTEILNLPYIMPAQAQKHVTHNEAIRILDVVVQLAVLSRQATTPPAAPNAGDRYIVPVGAQNAWAGQDTEVAAFVDGGWVFFSPIAGWMAYVVNEALFSVFDGTNWVLANDTPQILQNMSLVGINSTADLNNRLSIASPASLFTHQGNGHQIKINKAASADTASLVFQSNWSGRAEFGIAGGDDFSVKVSADGLVWTTALTIQAATGSASFGDLIKLQPRSKASLPAATALLTGSIAYVSDAIGGAQLAHCNGSAWVKVSDNLAV